MVQTKSLRIGGTVHHLASVFAAAPLAHYEPGGLRAGNAISVFGNADYDVGIEFPDL